jgi:hypothetical protein
MSNELTEAERAAAELLVGHMVGWEEMAKQIVAAVAPIVKRETLDRFGDRMGGRTWEQMKADTADNRYSVFNDNP